VWNRNSGCAVRGPDGARFQMVGSRWSEDNRVSDGAEVRSAEPV